MFRDLRFRVTLIIVLFTYRVLYKNAEDLHIAPRPVQWHIPCEYQKEMSKAPTYVSH